MARFLIPFILPPKGGRWREATEGVGGALNFLAHRHPTPTLPKTWGGSIIALSLLLTLPAHAAPETRTALATKICAAAEQEARANNIDPNYFARLLWRESLFDPNVVSNKGAQGIAQFMPDTAKRRGLIDPFEPVSAVKASAAFLADLRIQFGNLGLAAAAYNAGEQRVINWQAGKGGMPDETRDYVLFITGKPVEEWKQSIATATVPAIGNAASFTANCVALALRKGQMAGLHLRSAPRQPWGALLAAGFSESRSVALFQRLKLRFPTIIANRDPMVVRKRMLSRGTKQMVFVMLGEKSQAAAQAMCGQLQEAGAPCVVRRN